MKGRTNLREPSALSDKVGETIFHLDTIQITSDFTFTLVQILS